MNWLRRIFRRRKKGEVSISAVITRADGTVEDFGIISRGPVDFKAETK